MNRIILVLFSFFVIGLANAQDRPLRPNIKKDRTLNPKFEDSLGNQSRNRKSKGAVKNKDAKIEDYKIISRENDTIYVDTTLTINKDYKFNYLRKDDFDVLPFSNLGQTYNSLSYDFSNNNLMPNFGARARHFNYMEIDDINYYYMPTPFTELMFKTAFEQGQLLDAFFTVNTSKQFNFSIAYKGMRSLGKYQHILTSTGNFRFTTNYKTKNNRYNARAHIVMQDLLNEENGGLLDDDLINFESGNPEFIDRSVFDPVFENAENILEGKRFHLDHSYNLIQQKDSLNTNTLSIGNIVSFEDKFYQFDQDSQNSFFGDAFVNSSLRDRVTLEDFYAEANAKYYNNKVGLLKFNIGFTDFNYGYNSIVSLGGNQITNRLKGNVISAGGEYKNKIGAFLIHGKFGINIAGDFDGNFLSGKAGYNINEDAQVEASINISSKAPNYNFLLYQSDYINYNWQNNYSNIETKQLAFNFSSNKLINLELDYTSIDNFTYFEKSILDNNLVKPNQSNQTINYFRVKVSKELKYNKFTLNNTIRYQTVLDGEGIINVPEIVTRNTLYYSNHFFEKALYLQTGVTFSYFTKYNMNAYDPLLAEFYVQNETELGGFPRLDFFINAKIKQTRIFLKAEHFNSSLTGYNFYSAPNYPYRDFVVRFGIVWNFFL
ncbi:putative porin [Flavobacteriaceae bacterium AH-315-B10]|nr:putative porin [Flavobacteriaceae bacterium AH-315-B10]